MVFLHLIRLNAKIHTHLGLCLIVLCSSLTGCSTAARQGTAALPNDKLGFPGEKHFKNIRQLTHGGTNAEAYWSFDGRWLTFQAKGGGVPGLPQSKPDCDQIYRMRSDGTDAQLVSTGEGRTTCSFYLPGNERILYSSTHQADPACPTEPDRTKGYVWPAYNTYQFYSVNPDAPNSLQAFEPTAPRAYNAEAVTCKDGSVVFTSDRDGDLELYLGKLDSFGTLTQVKRFTNTPGYDGGAFFSQDCTKLVWRASRPKSEKELADYQELLKQHLVRPTKLEIWMANVDGTNARQVTRLNAASFAPYFTPKADRILFSSNFEDPKGRSFAIYSIRTNGTGLERITHSGVFDGFPMFSPDGKKLAFSSNRNGSAPRETNVFVADWVENSDEPTSELSFESSLPAERYLSVVKSLSAAEFAGRGIGTREMTQAEELTANLFERAGMKPFFSTFKASTQPAPGEGYKHAIRIRPLDESPQTKPGIVPIAKEAEVSLISGRNILGTLGQGCAKKVPAVVIGAHLDHLGLKHSGSLEPTKKGIHHGADDNASGVAAVIEAARMLSQQIDSNRKLSRNACFIFAAFTAEESGAAGSARVAELFEGMRIPMKAMLNMDMVGRLRDNKLIIFGTESASEWKTWVSEECQSLGLQCPGGGDGYGPSDQMSFYSKGVPVLHLFTGPHENYHRVSDTWEKINATGGVQVAEAVSRLAIRAASYPRKLKYQKASSQSFMAADSSSRQGMGSAFLGTIPDYAQLTSPSGPGGDTSKNGVLLSGARTGSPAEKAGVKAGDILFEIALATGEKKITPSLREFMGVLRILKAGDQVRLGIRRGKETLELPAIVGSRASE
ncbi:MAG: M28 family peptidase [Bdellovibrionales bacterium]|nr:M28 family peptidase [Bdellovibrionales bacterium]